MPVMNQRKPCGKGSNYCRPFRVPSTFDQLFDPLTRVLLARALRKRDSGEPFTRDSRRLKLVSGFARFALPRVDFRERRPSAAGASNAYDAWLGARTDFTDRFPVGRGFLVFAGFAFARFERRCSSVRNCSARVAISFLQSSGRRFKSTRH